ncbi:MAG: phosphatase PAP2 family protein [bacterium]
MTGLKSGIAFQTIDELELCVCVFFNGISRWKAFERLFAMISRLGNGIFWYALMVFMIILDRHLGLRASVHMGIAALIGVLIYEILKNNMVRQRPYISWKEIKQGTAPLDLYSFPSGHTLQASLFTIIAVFYYPALALILIPFTILIALSRIILGLHYPSDVFVGALIGMSLAYLSLRISTHIPFLIP